MQTLCRFLLTVKKNYRNIAYHNWRHAFNVCQSMFALMTVGVTCVHDFYDRDEVTLIVLSHIQK